MGVSARAGKKCRQTVTPQNKRKVVTRMRLWISIGLTVCCFINMIIGLFKRNNYATIGWAAAALQGCEGDSKHPISIIFAALFPSDIVVVSRHTAYEYAFILRLARLKNC